MSGTDYLADTNAVLYFLSGNECMKLYISSRFAFSVISEMELLSYQKITEDEEKKIRNFLGVCTPFGITEEIKNRAIQIRRKYQTKLPDAIIAATAIEKGLPLITADDGFRKITELDLRLIVPEAKN